MKASLRILFVITLSSIVFAEGGKNGTPANSPVIGDLDTLYINNIFLPFMNDGSVAETAQAYYPNPGLPVPSGYNLSFLFEGGLAATGYVNGELRASWIVKYNFLAYEWQPGKWGMGPNDPQAKFYRVKQSDGFGSQAYVDWADAVNLGADFQDLNNDGVYDPNIDRPDILGERTSWTVLNDGVETSQRFFHTLPMGLEIHQTVWALAQYDSLDDIIFSVIV